MPVNRSTMHSASPNYSDVDRKVIFVGYGYRWVKPKDPLVMDALLDRVECPVLRQLCGTTRNNDSFWSPSALDTPLRAWLHAIGVDSGLGVGFDDDNPGYRSGLTLEQLRSSTLYAPRLHARPRTQTSDLPGKDEELGVLREFAASVARAVDEGYTPSIAQLVESLNAGYTGDHWRLGIRLDGRNYLAIDTKINCHNKKMQLACYVGCWTLIRSTSQHISDSNVRPQQLLESCNGSGSMTNQIKMHGIVSRSCVDVILSNISSELRDRMSLLIYWRRLSSATQYPHARNQ